MSNKTDPNGVGVEMKKVGLDYGRVIADIIDERGRKIPIKRYHLRPEVPGAIEGIKILVTYLGADNVFIIRNGFGPNGGSRNQPLAIKKTWQWFERNKFFARTGVKRENVLFPDSREGKQRICEENGVTDLVDDRAEVAQHLKGVRWFAFRVEPDEIKKYAGAVSEETLRAMVKVDTWPALLDVMRHSFDPNSSQTLDDRMSSADREAWKRVRDQQATAEQNITAPAEPEQK